MSRTDKDRPWWVKEYQESNTHEHDHARGECIEQTLELAKFYNGAYTRRTKHYRVCKKRYTHTWTCTKQDPYMYTHYRYWNAKTRYRSGQECWTFRCRCTSIKGRRHIYSYECPTWGRVQCEGHSEIKHDPSIHCVCDDWPTPATCDWAGATDAYHRYYVHGGVPTWFVRQRYHRPERARERSLDEMRREYNIYGDIEDDDFENHQARGSARWMWW